MTDPSVGIPSGGATAAVSEMTSQDELNRHLKMPKNGKGFLKKKTRIQFDFLGT